MQKSERKAFTLVELLAVIVIIGVLAAAILGKFSQIQENGWSTQCKANLRNLYQASLNYSTDNSGTYPNAGAFESYMVNLQTSEIQWYEHKGWVNWTGTGTWPNGPNYDPAFNTGNMRAPIWWGNLARTSITNGSIWQYTSHDMNAYCCPKFRNLIQKMYSSTDQHYDVVRGYFMNSYLGCASQPGSVNLLTLDQEASRTLMFADMQPQQTYLGKGNPIICQYWAGYSGPGGIGDDSVLMATNKPLGASGVVTTESIGYIHHMAAEYRGHVVFLDGHVEAVGLANLGGGALSNRTYDACMGQF